MKNQKFSKFAAIVAALINNAIVLGCPVCAERDWSKHTEHTERQNANNEVGQTD